MPLTTEINIIPMGSMATCRMATHRILLARHNIPLMDTGIKGIRDIRGILLPMVILLTLLILPTQVIPIINTILILIIIPIPTMLNQQGRVVTVICS